MKKGTKYVVCPFCGDINYEDRDIKCPHYNHHFLIWKGYQKIAVFKKDFIQIEKPFLILKPGYGLVHDSVYGVVKQVRGYGEYLNEDGDIWALNGCECDPLCYASGLKYGIKVEVYDETI